MSTAELREQFRAALAGPDPEPENRDEADGSEADRLEAAHAVLQEALAQDDAAAGRGRG